MLRRLAAAACVLAALTLSSCSSTVHIEPAKDANDPLCAEVTVRLPSALADQDRRWTDAQATGAWAAQGSTDSTTIVSCGVEVPGPTSQLQCISIEGVDWLVDPAKEPWMRMTTYGRDPAVQVFVNTKVVNGNAVLSNRSLVTAVQKIPVDRKCIAPDKLPDGYEAPKG